MILGVYAMQDARVGFLTPTVESNDAVAMRNFEHGLLASQSVLRTHAADFSLYKIGTYDSDTGLLSPLVPPAQVISGLSIVQANKE